MRKLKLIVLLLTSFLFPLVSRAQIGQRTFSTTVVANDVGIGNIGSGIAWHQLTWNITGSVPTCSVKLQSSADNITYADLITSQTCTSNGQSTVVNSIVNYIKIEVTVKSGAGSVVVLWDGFNTNPAGGGGGTITGSGVAGQATFWTDTSVISSNSLYVWDNTHIALGVGPLITLPAGDLQLPLADIGISSQMINIVGVGGVRIPAEFVGSAPDGGSATFSEGSLSIATSTGTNSSFGFEAEAHVAPTVAQTIPFTTEPPAVGEEGYANNVGAGTVGAVTGSLADAENLGTGTLTNGIDYFSAKVNNLGGGALTNAIGHYFQAQSSGTNNYGLYFEDFGAGANNYGIFQVGTNTKNTLANLTVTGTCTGCGGGFTGSVGAGQVALGNGGATLTSSANIRSDGSSGLIIAGDLALGGNIVDVVSDAQTATISKYRTFSNCSSAASPAVCGASSAGSVIVAAGATSVVVNTNQLTANSQIFIQFDSSLGTKLGVTCNTTVDLGQVTARSAGVSFTITSAAAPVVNPACYSYFYIN